MNHTSWEDLLAERYARSRLVDAYYTIRRIVRHTPKNTYRGIKFAWQRVVRGWDDSSTWCLHSHLGRTLGGQLVYMADNTHSFPGRPPYDTFELWQRDLRKHGTALLTYEEQELDAEGDEWMALFVPAQEALRWVADFLPYLWD